MALLCLAIPAHAAAASPHPLKGVALVIGETNYVRLPVLTNPDKDARDVDHMLDDLGFDVTRALDVSSGDLQGKIDRFIDDAKDADVALVYYAGHGIEAGGKDYIMGTDADISNAASASQTLVSLDDTLARLRKAVPVTILLLDACRTNPFTGQQTLDLTPDGAPVAIGAQGLEAVRSTMPVGTGKPDGGLGMVIGFSASPGQSALDGPPGANSPYASALLEHLTAGGFSFGDIMTMVTQEVYVDTGARQLPWTSSSLSRVLYFGRGADTASGDDAQILGDRRKLLLQIATLPDQSKAYVEAVATQEDLKLADLYSMLDIINGNKAAPGDAGHQALLDVAKRVREVLDDPILSAAPSDPELARLDGLASKAIAAGAFQRAYGYRQQEAKRAAEIEKDLDTQQAAVNQQQADIEAKRQELAGVYARVAESAMYAVNPTAEAEAYKRAASESDLFDKSISIRLRLRAANALADQAEDNMDAHRGQLAVAMYQDILKDVDQSRQPVVWADTQLRMGWAMLKTSWRNGDKTVRNEAVAAARAALTVFHPTGDIRRWRNANVMLAQALEGVWPGPAEASDVLSRLLKATARSQAPLDWATAEDVLGELFYEFGLDVDGDTTFLDEASTAFKAAATASARFDPGLHNYASIVAAEVDTYSAIRRKDRGAVLAALAEGRAALTFEDPKKSPLPWAGDAGRIGRTLISAGLFLSDASLLKEGLALHASSEKLVPRDKDRFQWTLNRESDGDALTWLGSQAPKPDVKQLTAAAAAYDDAYESLRDQDDSHTDRPRLKKIAVLQLLGKKLSASDAAFVSFPPPANIDFSAIKLAVFASDGGSDNTRFTIRLDGGRSLGLAPFVSIQADFPTSDKNAGMTAQLHMDVGTSYLSQPDSQQADYSHCDNADMSGHQVPLFFGAEKYLNACMFSRMAPADAAAWQAVVAVLPSLVHAAAVAGDANAAELDQIFAAKPDSIVIVRD